MKFWKKLSWIRVIMYMVSVGAVSTMLYLALIATPMIVPLFAIAYFITPVGYAILCALIAAIPFHYAKRKNAETGKRGFFLLDFLAVLIGGALCFGAASLVTEYQTKTNGHHQGAQAAALQLTLPDGRVYSISDLRDENGYPLYLGLQGMSEPNYEVRSVKEPEK